MKGKIILVVFVLIFIFGAYNVLSKKEPYEKYIGEVFINSYDKTFTLEGYKVKSIYEKKSKEYDTPLLAEIANSIIIIDGKNKAMEALATSVTSSIITTSNTDISTESVSTETTSIETFETEAEKIDTYMAFQGSHFMDAKYTLYNENLEIVYENEDYLNIEVGTAGYYIVQADVNWGLEKNNITIRYFYKIKLN